ncbi:MAG: hypothetical protein Q7K37_11425 [Dehalococcoidia bacterium]|nr:hypothetical protein [Dehalococcoidia bacterium]
MPDITSRDENLSDTLQAAAAAREEAMEEIRRWRDEADARSRSADEVMQLIHDLQKRIHLGGQKFTREEMNGR